MPNNTKHLESSVLQYLLHEAALEGVIDKLVLSNLPVPVFVHCLPGVSRIQIIISTSFISPKSIINVLSVILLTVLLPDIVDTGHEKILIVLNLSHSEEVQDDVPAQYSSHKIILPAKPGIRIFC